MQYFIDNYGTHYAKKSEMGVGMEFETRYNREETRDSTVEQRNKCNNKSKGFSVFGIGASSESNECSSFDAAANDAGSSLVRRNESITYGVLPSEGGFGSVGEWGTRVQEMWVAGNLSPIPIKQELEPIYKILLTDTVKNIVHDDETELNWMNVLRTAVKYYSEYCTIMGDCDFPACPEIVYLDGDTYNKNHGTQGRPIYHATQGRPIYKDVENGNYLMYHEEGYINQWRVTPFNDHQSIIKQTAPCPQQGGKFHLIGPASNPKYPKHLPSQSWSDCSIKCLDDVNCKYWQYNKVCQLIVEFDSIVADDDYIIGSRDCPGDSKAYQSSYGQCPNTFKGKSMWKVGNEKFFNKTLRIIARFSCEANTIGRKQYCRCPPGTRISVFKSKHSNYEDDRVWELKCDPIPPVEIPFDSSAELHETAYGTFKQVQFWDGEAKNSFMVGMESNHDNGKEDRQYKYYYQNSENWVLSKCDWVTTNDDYVLPSDRVIAGIWSANTFFSEDRMFWLKICTLSPRI